MRPTPDRLTPYEWWPVHKTRQDKTDRGETRDRDFTSKLASAGLNTPLQCHHLHLCVQLKEERAARCSDILTANGHDCSAHFCHLNHFCHSSPVLSIHINLFVNLTTFVNFCQLRAHQFCQQYQPLMSLQTRSLLLSTRPDHFCQP